MSEFGLGLILTPDHESFVNSFSKLPAAFCAAGDPVPDFQSPVPVFNQSGTSSCAGHAGAANFIHRQYVETGDVIKFSPWYSYITSQKRGGFFGRDGGTSIRSVVDAATLDGCCLESLCKRPDRYDTNLSREAVSDAAEHKHLGEVVDLRDVNSLMSWLYDFRSAIIGTKWLSGQSSVRDRETLRHANGGSFQGYHARALIGHKGGCPVVLNSHGSSWGVDGRAVLDLDVIEHWLRDPNYVCLGFTDINERVPKRRDFSQFSFILGNKPSIG